VKLNDDGRGKRKEAPTAAKRGKNAAADPKKKQKKKKKTPSCLISRAPRPSLPLRFDSTNTQIPPTKTTKQADARVVQSYGLKVEQSSLTGESDLVPVAVERVSDEALEARNLVFAGCLVMQGSGRIVVVRTGDRTMIGRIAALAGGGSGGGDGEKEAKTTLQIEIHRLIVFVGIVAAVVPVMLFAIGAARQRLSPLQAFVNGFVLAVVACVLQGMRATVLSLLALCSTRLREKNVLIKRTDTIENLGCATVICSDKVRLVSRCRDCGGVVGSGLWPLVWSF